MSKPYVISIMSHDRVGIIADVTGAIKQLHGNLEDMSQTVMKGYFTMLLLADFPGDVNEEQLKAALHAVKGLSSFEIGLLPYEPPKPSKQKPAANDDLYVVTASGPDRVGLVAELTEYLRLKEINIIDLATRCEQSTYTMMLLVKLPEGTDVAKLKKGLRIAMETVGLSVEIRHQAIFSKTNEI